MYWRRFRVSSIPTDDSKTFELWLKSRWLEKEDLLEQYAQNGRFPASQGHGSEGEPPVNHAQGAKVSEGTGYIETEVRLVHWYEVGQIFVVLAAIALLANVLAKIWNLAFYHNLYGKG